MYHCRFDPSSKILNGIRQQYLKFEQYPKPHGGWINVLKWKMNLQSFAFQHHIQLYFSPLISPSLFSLQLPTPLYFTFIFPREVNSLEYSSLNTDNQAGFVLQILLPLEVTLILGFQMIISLTATNIIQSEWFKITGKSTS